MAKRSTEPAWHNELLHDDPDVSGSITTDEVFSLETKQKMSVSSFYVDAGALGEAASGEAASEARSSRGDVRAPGALPAVHRAGAAVPSRQRPLLGQLQPQRSALDANVVPGTLLFYVPIIFSPVARRPRFARCGSDFLRDPLDCCPNRQLVIGLKRAGDILPLSLSLLPSLVHALSSIFVVSYSNARVISSGPAYL